MWLDGGDPSTFTANKVRKAWLWAKGLCFGRIFDNFREMGGNQEKIREKKSMLNLAKGGDNLSTPFDKNENI